VQVTDVKVVHGDQPFLEKALAAVHTWTFLPGRANGRAVEAWIAIVFQFSQPYVPPRASTIHAYDQNSTAAVPDSAAVHDRRAKISASEQRRRQCDPVRID
jgi:TonB-like protein